MLGSDLVYDVADEIEETVRLMSPHSVMVFHPMMSSFIGLLVVTKAST